MTSENLLFLDITYFIVYRTIDSTKCKIFYYLSILTSLEMKGLFSLIK